MHKNKHRDAHIAPIFQEDISEFEQKVRKHGKKEEEPSIIQYDMHSKKFVAGCQCGEKFSIDIKNDTIEQVNPNLKMKEFNNYDRKTQENQGQSQYGGSQAGENQQYNMGPKRQPNPAYSNSSGSSKYNN
jgi:inhibitor of KinA sporulation pathway (predicted exonuclease)